MATRVRTGCQNCSKCTGSVVGNVGRAAGRAGAATMTFGMSELMARKCRACGHMQMLHQSAEPVVQQDVQVSVQPFPYQPQPYPVQPPQYPYQPQPYPGPQPQYVQPVPPLPHPGPSPYPVPPQHLAPPQYPPAPPAQRPVDRAARLRELKDLRDQDLITEEEFQAQRQEIIRSV
ncbi:SHOCT domain-containing protein [Kitasatospora purpeofusca]|uniref:SHOCT domain-containing protein n=1 Tax=Kitasatospora purpeofusca TaxID=67352 RepID=UPI0037FA9DE0